MEQSNWGSDKMLDLYIYDYMLKRNLHCSARTFLTEGKIATDTEVVDAPRGYLLEWWSVFWDIYTARSNGKASDSAAAYIEMQQFKAWKQREQQVRLQLSQLQQSLLETSADLMGANRMGFPESTFNHQGQMMQGNFGSMSESLQQMQGRAHLASKSLPMDPSSVYGQNFFQSKSELGSAGLSKGVTGLPLKGLPLKMEMAQMQNPFSQMAPKQNNRKRKQCSNQIDNLESLGDAGFFEDNVDTVSLPGGGAGFPLVEVGCIRTENKLRCSHFSSDGKFLAIGGHGNKAVLWNMKTLGIEYTLEKHQRVITDVRFRPESTQLATSSLDKSVRIWDADNPGHCVHAYTRHASTIMSLDFHPSKNDLFCFSDTKDEVHYWSINPFSHTRVSKQRGRVCVRFQPTGHLVAAARDNVVSIYDVENDKHTLSLQGHSGVVGYLCWDINGDRLASVSNDRIKIWSLASGECIRELIDGNGKQFHCCVFHQGHSDVLVVGGLRSMELWNMTENKMMAMPTHEEIVALAQSPQTGTIASAGRDGIVKLWI